MAKPNGKVQPKQEKFPSKIAPCVDLAYTRQQARQKFQKEMERKLEALKADEDAIIKHIIDTFTADQMSKAGGLIATGTIEVQKYPNLKDPAKFFAYVAKTKQFDLIEKRVAKTAWRERIEDGKTVPGVEVFPKKVLHLNKISK